MSKCAVDCVHDTGQSGMGVYCYLWRACRHPLPDKAVQKSQVIRVVPAVRCSLCERSAELCETSAVAFIREKDLVRRRASDNSRWREGCCSGCQRIHAPEDL